VTEPLFPHRVTPVFWSGVVNRIEPGNIGWGSRSDGKTFDTPLPDGCDIGTRVEFYEAGVNPDGESEFDYLMVIRADHACWLYWLDDTPNGYEIQGVSMYPKIN